MQYNWTPYAVGGATRPDSFSRMSPQMQAGLWAMLQAADQEVGQGLQVYSGYRSPELQAKLFNDAVAKYGSEAKARKWVAPPGRSRHNTGQAADLKWNGTRIDKLPEDHPVRAWMSQNLSRFGLAAPMSWEPWQVELAGARTGTISPPKKPLTFGGMGPAPTQTNRNPFGFGNTLGAEDDESGIWALLSSQAGQDMAEAMTQQQAPAPQVLQAPVAPPQKPMNRSTAAAYRRLFERVRRA